MTASFSAALDTGHPDRFSDTHLKTLQRRVQQWRGIMAKKLVYTTAGEPMPELPARNEPSRGPPPRSLACSAW